MTIQTTFSGSAKHYNRSTRNCSPNWKASAKSFKME
jgi:hypothetical protein